MNLFTYCIVYMETLAVNVLRTFEISESFLVCMALKVTKTL